MVAVMRRVDHRQHLGGVEFGQHDHLAALDDRRDEERRARVRR
jgi:hypothetical protein